MLRTWMQNATHWELNVAITQNNIAYIDECSNKTYHCVGNATCVDTVGLFNCTCDVGMVGDGYLNGSKCVGKI